MDISELLAEELAEYDRRDPDWYRPALVATVVDAIRGGEARDMLQRVYGASIYAEAEKRVRAEAHEMLPSARASRAT